MGNFLFFNAPYYIFVISVELSPFANHLYYYQLINNLPKFTNSKSIVDSELLYKKEPLEISF